jgi:hypothetical protein
MTLLETSSDSLTRDKVLFPVQQEDAMSIYFIDFLSSNGIVAEDEIGQEYPGLKEAEAEAIQSGRELLSEQIGSPRDYVLEAVLISQENGQEIKRIFARDIWPVY